LTFQLFAEHVIRNEPTSTPVLARYRQRRRSPEIDTKQQIRLQIGASSTFGSATREATPTFTLVGTVFFFLFVDGNTDTWVSKTILHYTWMVSALQSPTFLLEECQVTRAESKKSNNCFHFTPCPNTAIAKSANWQKLTCQHQKLIELSTYYSTKETTSIVSQKRCISKRIVGAETATCNSHLHTMPSPIRLMLIDQSEVTSIAFPLEPLFHYGYCQECELYRRYMSINWVLREIRTYRHEPNHVYELILFRTF